MSRFFACLRQYSVCCVLIISAFLIGINEAQAQTCSSLPFFTPFSGFPTTYNPCAPVTTSIQYKLSFSSPLPTLTTGQYQVSFEWRDGTGATFVNLGTSPAGSPIQNIDLTKSHPFPTNSDCEYNVRIFLLVNGSACNATIQNQYVQSWKTDAFNNPTFGTGTGIKLISPTTSNANKAIHEVCEGVDINVTFQDLSEFNCNANYDPANTLYPAGVINGPNQVKRWQQIVYNTPNAAARIPNISVNGVLMPAAAGTNYQDPRGIYILPTPVVVSDPNRRNALPITAPGGFGAGFPVVGDEFEITLRYWNFCNPYDDPNIAGLPSDPINGDNPPVEQTAIVRIIAAPNPPTVTPSGPFCETLADTGFEFSASTTLTGANIKYTWYDSDGTTILQGPAADNTFNPVTEGPSAKRINKTVSASTTFHRFVDVRQGTNCVSEKRDIVIRIDDTNIPGVIAHPLSATTPIIVCSGTNPVAFTSTTAGTGGGPSGTFTYQWQSSTDAAFTSPTTVGTNSSVFDPPAVTGTIFYRRQVISGTCATVNSNVIEFRADTPVQPGSIGNAQILCSGISVPTAISDAVSGSGGTGTNGYTWQSSTDNFGAVINTISGEVSAMYTPPILFVDTWYRRINTSGVCSPLFAISNPIKMTVNQAVVPGSIGNPQIICANGDPGVITSLTLPSGGDGTTYTYLWEESATGGGAGFATASGTTNGATYDPPVLTATRFYRRKVTSGVCAATYSNEIKVTVNPLPTASVTGGGSACNLTPAADVVFTFTGTPPYNVTIQVASTPDVPDITLTGYNSNTYSIVAPNPTVTTTYKVISLTDANTCAATGAGLGGTATVTPQAVPPPTVDFFTAQPAVCDDGGATDPPNAFLDLNPDQAETYNIGYKLKNLNTGVETIVAPANFLSDAAGIVTISPTYAQLGNAPEPLGYKVIVTSIYNTVTLCAGAVPINGPVLIVNPRPAAPTSPVNSVACSTAGVGSPMSVALPGAGLEIIWSTGGPALASFAAVGTGTVSGTKNETYTPSTSANGTFYAFTRNTTTLCVSTTGIAVTQTRDNKPTNAVAGPDQPNLCATGTTLAATAADNSGSGKWTVVGPPGTIFITDPTIFNTTVTGLPQDVPGGVDKVTTFRWTVSSLLSASTGGCAATTDDVVITVHPLPVANTPSAASRTFCEDYPITGTHQHTGVDLVTTYDNLITGGALNTTVTWTRQTPGPVALLGVAPGLQNVTASHTYTALVTNTVTNCTNTTTVNIIINQLPTVNTSVPIAKCSDAAGGTVAVLDLTSFNTNINSGAGLTFTWWHDAAATALPITPGNAGGQDEKYTVSNGEVLYARVHNTATGCENIGSIIFTINTTPVGNTIVGPTNVCVSVATVLYQVTPHAGAKYSWNIPSQITVFGGGSGAVAGGGQGPFGNDSYVLLIFPTAATGLSISVTERSAANCTGAANTKLINVANGPTVVDILHPPDTYLTPVASRKTSFCKNEMGVVFSVPANATSNFIWTIDEGANLGGTIVGASAGTGLNQIIIDFKNQSSAKIDVTEINISGCPAIYPSLVVSLVDSPILTPISKSICSGEQPSSVIDLNAQVTQPSTFKWFIKSIDPAITGAFKDDIGVGPLEHFPPLKNISGANGTIVYTVTPTASSGPGCVGLPQDFTVIIKPEPVVTAITDKSFCTGAAVSIPLSSNVSGATMNWTSTNSAAVGQLIASGSGTISFTAAENLTGATITTIINVTATSNGCSSTGGNSKSFVITIKPRPVVDAITAIVVCPGEPISVPLFSSNTGGGETYAWTNDKTSIGLGASGSGNIGGYFAPANNTGVDVVGTVNVKGTLAGCEGPPTAFTITIKPEPVVNAVTNKLFCPGDVINIPLSTNVSGAVISWTNSNTAVGLLASSTGDIGSASTFAAVNNTGADIVATINISASNNSCTSSGTNLKSFTITVKPTPIVDPITDIVVCSGGTVPTTVFGSNITAGGVTFNWTNDNTLISPSLAATGNSNITTFTAAINTTGLPRVANISVTGTKNSCAGPARTFKITVNPEPVVDPITPNSFCPGDAVSFTLTSNVVGATLKWTNSNPSIGLAASGNGDISFTAPVNNTGGNITATINVTAESSGCTSAGGNAKSFTITINPTPIVQAVADVVICSGASTTAINFASDTGTGSEVYNWTNDNSSINLGSLGSGNIGVFTPPTNFTGVPVIANISVSATLNGCPGPSKAFKIIINPEPVVVAVTDKEFCAGESISIPLTSNVAGATISWTNSNSTIGLATSGTGDISYIAPVNNTGSNITGTVIVKASKNSCTSAGANVKTFTITIKPTPIVDVIPNVVVCSGQTVSAIAFGSNAGAGVSFDWTNDTPAINLVASGTTTVGLSSFTAASNVSSSPVVATISVMGTKNTCQGPARTFTITILPEPVGTPTAIPICSDAAVAVNLNTLITSGASASTYNISINAHGLSPSAGSPTNGFGLSATEIQDDRWTNLTGAQVDVVYSIVPISGSTPNCSGASFDLTVHVNPEPVVTAIVDKFYCPATPQTIPLLSNVPGATITWTNDNPLIGLGVTSTGDISFTTAANNSGSPIVANISVSASKNGCTSIGTRIKTFKITIKPTPIVNPVTDIVVCSGESIPDIALAANTGGGETFSWTNDNTAINIAALGSSNPIHQSTPAVNITGLPRVANFTVFATVNGCPGPTRTFKVTVNPEPVVTAILPQEFCAGESINIPFASNVPGATITWTNDNTAIGIGTGGSGNIVYVAPVNNTGVDIVGTINVIAAKNTCVSSGANAKTFTIKIKPTPIVTTISNITVCSGQTVSAIAFSSNLSPDVGVSFDWTNDNPAINLLASGNGNIASFTAATNISSAPMVATISVTGKKNTCTGPSKTFTITIDPVPVVQTGLDNNVCSGQPTGLILNTNGTSVAALNYNIISRTVDPGLVTITAASVPGGGINGKSSIYLSGDKFRNTTGASLPVVYKVAAVGAIHNCVGPQKTITIMIDPEPVLSNSLDGPVCSHDFSPLVLNTNGLSVAAASYNILNRTIGGGLTAMSTVTVPASNVAANYLTGDKFKNTTSNPIIVTYLVEPVAGGTLNCVGAQKTITITVNPEPVGINYVEPGCTSGVLIIHDIQALQITNGVASKFTYTVTSTNAGVPAAPDRLVADNSSISVTYTNTTGSPAVIVYTITPISTLGSGCSGDPITYTINVDSKPVSSAGASLVPIVKATKCSEESFSFNPQADINTAPGNSVPSTFTWSLVYDGGAPVLGTGNVTGSFHNESTAVKFADFTVTPQSSSGSGCFGPNFIIRVPINPQPVMVAVPVTTLCSTNSSGSHATGITLSTTPTSGTPTGFNIVLKSIDAGLDGLGTTPDVVGLVGNGMVASAMSGYTYRNTSSVPLSVVYTITPVAGICAGAPIDITFKVNPEPVLLNPGLDVTTCSDVNSGLVFTTNGISVAAVKYKITIFSAGGLGEASTNILKTATALPIIVTANQLASEKFTNTGMAAVNVSYTVVPIGPLPTSCEGQSLVIKVAVKPEPRLSPGTGATCSDNPSGSGIILGGAAGSNIPDGYTLTKIEQIGPPPIPLVAGTGNAGLGASTNDHLLFNDRWTNVNATDQIIRYTIVPSFNGCSGDPEFVDLTIHPSPTLKAGLDKIVCNSAITGVVLMDNSPTSAAAAKYKIVNVAFDGTKLTPDPANAAFPFTTTDVNYIKNDKFKNLTNDRVSIVYEVKPVSGSVPECTGPSGYITVTVEPSILVTTAGMNHNPDICSGTPVNIEFQSPTYTGLLDPTNPLVANPVVTFSYKLQTPIPSGILGYTSGNNLNEGEAIEDVLVNTSSTNEPVTVTYLVTAKAAAAASGAGCPGETKSFDVIVQPRPKINSISNKTFCEGVPLGIALTSPTYPSDPGKMQFELQVISNPGGITGATPNGTMLANGFVLNDNLVNDNPSFSPQVITYQLTPSSVGATSCAGLPITFEVTVNPRPVVIPEVTNLEICSGESINVKLETNTDPSETIVIWTKEASSDDVLGESNGAGDVLFQTLLNKSNAPQTVKYTVTPSFNGCKGDPKIVTVIINPIPSIALPSKLTICAGTEFNLNLSPLATTASANTTFKWEITDVNGIGAPGEFDGPFAGTQISKLFNNNTDAYATMVFLVTPQFVRTDGTFCEGISKQVNVTVGASIVPKISESVEICAGSSVSLTFELGGTGPFEFVYRATDMVNGGSVDKTVTKSGNVNQVKVAPSVTTLYEIVSVKDGLGCSKEFPTTGVSSADNVTITVYDMVAADFEANIPPFIGGTAAVGFTNTSTPVDGSIFDYKWTFSTDGEADLVEADGEGPFVVNYTRSGDHYVSVTASNKFAPADLGCESTKAKKITIPVLPLAADFEFDPKAGCFPQLITVTKNTATGNRMDWTVIDENGSIAATSTANEPIFEIPNPGKYSILLKTSDTFTKQEAFAPTGKDFVIYANPVASFDLRPALVYVPDTELTTFNFSTGAPEYLWDFGDGNTSTEKEPKYMYKVEGKYDVTLVAINDHGDGAVCTDTLKRKVIARQGGVTKVPNAFTPNPGGPSGGTAGNNTFNDVFLPIVKGAEEFNMQIFDRWGNLIFETNNSNIGWDGYDKHGKLLPAGVYVYKLTLRLSDGQRSTQLGDITMIR